MPRLPFAPPRHDPFWDLDGAGVRRARTRRRSVQWIAWLVALAVLAFALDRLATLDVVGLMEGQSRPILAAAMLGLIGAAGLLALARVRSLGRH